MWSVASGHLCLLFLIVVPCCLCSPGNAHSCSFAQGTPTWDPELRASRCLGKTAAKLAGRNVAPSTKKSVFTSTAMRREPVLYKQASNRGFIYEAERICCFFRKSSPGFPSKDFKIFPSPLRFIDLLKKAKETASKRNIFFLSTVWLPKKPRWPVLCQARARKEPGWSSALLGAEAICYSFLMRISRGLHWKPSSQDSDWHLQGIPVLQAEVSRTAPQQQQYHTHHHMYSFCLLSFPPCSLWYHVWCWWYFFFPHVFSSVLCDIFHWESWVICSSLCYHYLRIILKADLPCYGFC